MIILAADLASTTGFAITDRDDPSCPILDTLEVTGDHPKRFHDFRTGFWKMLVTYRPAWVVYEAAIPQHGTTNFNTSSILLGLIAVASETAYAFSRTGAGNGFPQIGDANSATVRRHFIGTNRGKSADLKNQVKLRCMRLGWRALNDHEADAAAVWSYWTHRMGVAHPQLVMEASR